MYIVYHALDAAVDARAYFFTNLPIDVVGIGRWVGSYFGSFFDGAKNWCIFVVMNSEAYSDYNIDPIDIQDGYQPLGQHGHSLVGRMVRHGQVWFVKSYSSSLAEGDARLRKEYEIMLRLNHPAILRAAWLETIQGIGLGLVTEWVEGETLDCWAGHADRKERRLISDQLLRAVAYMHGYGVTHLDLKPQNVMVTGHGENVALKIVDFGMAQTDNNVLFRHPGGTQGFSAPEQWEEGYEPSPRSDVYSVGRLLALIDGGGVYRRLASRATSAYPLRRPCDGGELLALRKRLRRRERRMAWLFIVGVGALVANLMFASHIWRDGSTADDDHAATSVDTVAVVVKAAGDTVQSHASPCVKVPAIEAVELESEYDKLIAQWSRELDRCADRIEAIAANETLSKAERRALIEPMNDSIMYATQEFFRPYVESVGSDEARSHPLSWCTIYEPAFESARMRMRVAYGRLQD